MVTIGLKGRILIVNLKRKILVFGLLTLILFCGFRCYFNLFVEKTQYFLLKMLFRKGEVRTLVLHFLSEYMVVGSALGNETLRINSKSKRT